jgi:hypothetical protein
MKRENFYLLLYLDIFPPENDAERINNAINQKQKEWSKARSHPTKATTAQSYLDMLPQIKTAMNDDAKRGQEAKQAQETILEDLDKAIRILASKQRITEGELEGLNRMFSNIPNQLIRQRINVPITEKTDKKAAPETLERSVHNAILNSLEIIGKNSLYDFLGESPDTSIEILSKKREQREGELRKQNNKDARLAASQKLIGQCITVFKTEEMRKKYDASLALQRLARLDKKIDIAGMDGNIAGEEFDSLMEEAQEMGLQYDETETYIFNYCMKKGWPVKILTRTSPKEKKKICGQCGTVNPAGEKECTNCKTLFEVKCPRCRRFTPTDKTDCAGCGFHIAGMPKALPLLEQAKNNAANGHLEKAADLLNRALHYWPNHPESLIMQQELKERENNIAELAHHLNTGNPRLRYGISKAVIGAAAIILSFVSAFTAIKTIIHLLKAKSYIGNEPYLAATILTLIISGAIFKIGIKTLISTLEDIKGKTIPATPQFEVYGDVEHALAQNPGKHGQTTLETIIAKDRTFITIFLIFLGLEALFFTVKHFLPNEFFWDLRLTPQYFSFPLFLTLALAAAAVLRGAFVYYHSPAGNREINAGHQRKIIKSGTPPATVAPEIKQKLSAVQTDGKPNMTYYSGLSSTGDGSGKKGKIHGKLFVETHPEPISPVNPSFIYLYLSLAVLLTGIGFYWMTKHPPHNISVLSVPTIAIGYIWAIIKGGVLVYAGVGLLTNISRLTGTQFFKSVIIVVDISGEKITGTNHHNWEFNIFSAALNTEMNIPNGNRQIIRMSKGKESEHATKFVTDAVEAFR